MVDMQCKLEEEEETWQASPLLFWYAFLNWPEDAAEHSSSGLSEGCKS